MKNWKTDQMKNEKLNYWTKKKMRERNECFLSTFNIFVFFFALLCIALLCIAADKQKPNCCWVNKMSHMMEVLFPWINATACNRRMIKFPTKVFCLVNFHSFKIQQEQTRFNFEIKCAKFSNRTLKSNSLGFEFIKNVGDKRE